MLRDWLKTTFAQPAREFPQFPAALAFVKILTPKEALSALEQRAEELGRHLDAEARTLKRVRASGLPRLFLIDDEYRHRMARAELEWLRGLIGDLRNKTITWSERFLREISARFGSDPS